MSDDITNSNKPYLIEIDPAVLLAHPSNPRSDIGDVSELAATLTAEGGVGLLQPVVLVPEDGGYRIVAGHRRTKAAFEAGLNPIPALVRPDLAGLEPEQIAAALIENEERKPLTRTDVAKGYEQLAAFPDWNPERIARVTGKPVDHVNGQLALAALPENVRAIADTGSLTLEDSTAILELSDDPKFLERIERSASNSWGVRHTIVEERLKRKNKARAAELKIELERLGVALIKRPKGWPDACPEAPVGSLRDADGKGLDPDAVKTQPGFAAFIETSGSPVVVVVCLRPDAHGLRRTSYTSYESPAEQQRKAEAAEAANALREVLAAAALVRHEFLRERFGNAKGAKSQYQEALRCAVLQPALLRVDDDRESLLTTLAGADPEAASTAKQDRLSRMLVARWIAAQESALASVVRGYRGPDGVARSVTWLELLTDAGYALGEAETQFLDELREYLTAQGYDEEDGDFDFEEDAFDEADSDPLSVLDDREENA